jgi:hypothetical protein
MLWAAACLDARCSLAGSGNLRERCSRRRPFGCRGRRRLVCLVAREVTHTVGVTQRIERLSAGGATVRGSASFRLPTLLGSTHTRQRPQSVSTCSTESMLGEMAPIMTVWQSPMNESRNTSVSLEPRKGMCVFPWSSPRMHSCARGVTHGVNPADRGRGASRGQPPDA